MSSKIIAGVLASGRGSNFQSILDKISSGELSLQIGVVIADKADAYVLQRAAAAGIPAVVILRQDYSSKEAFEQALIECLQAHKVELLVLAGFMRILSSQVIRAFPEKIINIHPSLLPSFPGLQAQKQAIDYGAKYSGCTVHFVDEGMDSGPIIMQAIVEVAEDDNEASLAAKILEKEHEILPRVLQLSVQGKIAVQGRQVKILK